ncbi:MAG: hypothetical protein C0432_04050 [Candidatus Puniceispirillum sp.]|nr:hypothetical protein [Candidatus Pelagibacter sp.]MBA4283448.1 hypothetical protein [Candidatus Puniceispirillum sp.]
MISQQKIILFTVVFLWRYKYIRDQTNLLTSFKSLLNRSNNLSTLKVFVSGHSLGGALAVLFISDIMDRILGVAHILGAQNASLLKLHNIHLFSFSAPALFSKSLADHISSLLNENSYRLYSSGDLVKSKKLGYYHVARKSIKIVNKRKSLLGSHSAHNFRSVSDGEQNELIQTVEGLNLVNDQNTGAQTENPNNDQEVIFE